MTMFLGAVNAQSGGSYSVTQSVIGGIGGNSTGGSYELDGTGGQPLAGGDSTGGGYGVAGGYWPMLPIAPTSAGISIGGKVQDVDGRPIRNMTVTLVGGPLSAPRTAKTNGFGAFRFDGVELGYTYVVGVVSRRFGFAEQHMVLTPLDSLSDVVFRAAWRN